MESDEAETISSAESVTRVTSASNRLSTTSVISDVTEDVTESISSGTDKSTSYSEADTFRSQTWKQPPRITPRTPRTGRYTPSVAYSADFESATLTTARYSDDFENTTRTGSHSNIGRYSTESLQSSRSTLGYSHSFESYTASFDSSETESQSDSKDSTTLSASRSSDVSSTLSGADYSRTGDDQDESRTESYSSDWSTEESEVSETTKLAEETVMAAFIARKLGALRRTSQKPSSTPHHTPRPPITPRVDKPLSEFCSKKLKVLKKKRNCRMVETAESTDLSAAEPRRRWSEVIAHTQVEDWGISKKKMEHLRWENFQQSVKNLKNAPIHEPGKCKQCIEKMAEMEAREFIKQKFAVVSERCINEKLANPAFLYTDAIGVMGTHLQTFPRVDDEPDVIRERLMEPLIQNYISSARVPVKVADDAEKACGVTRDKFWETFLKPLHEKEPYKSHYNPGSVKETSPQPDVEETFRHIGVETLWSESLQKVKQKSAPLSKSETGSSDKTWSQYAGIGPLDIYSLHELDELEQQEEDRTIDDSEEKFDHDITSPVEDTSTESGSNILSFGQLQALDDVPENSVNVGNGYLPELANEDGVEGLVEASGAVLQLDALQCVMEGQQYESDDTVMSSRQSDDHRLRYSDDYSFHERLLRSNSIKFADESLPSSHSDPGELTHQYDPSSYNTDSLHQNVFNIDDLNILSIKEGSAFEKDIGGDIISTEGSDIVSKDESEPEEIITQSVSSSAS